MKVRVRVKKGFNTSFLLNAWGGKQTEGDSD